jgi:RES domain-containing protein
MPVAWRIVKKEFAGRAFDGEGARINGGRWNSIGAPLVYLSGSRALVVLEMLVHLHDEDTLRDGYVLYEIGYEAKHRRDVQKADLPVDWKSSPASPAAAAVGDRFCAQKKSLLLGVPSAILPAETNLLLNPHHAAMKELRITGPSKLDIDPRLIRRV